MNTTASTPSTSSVRTLEGSCHCGALRFEAKVDLSKGASRCNCSVCSRIAQTSIIVKPEDFTTSAGEDVYATYEWGGKTAKRYFCKNCGVHCFGRGYLAELGGDYVSINLNCVDDVDVNALDIVYWDGRHDNWMAGPRPAPWPKFTNA